MHIYSVYDFSIGERERERETPQNIDVRETVALMCIWDAYVFSINDLSVRKEESSLLTCNVQWMQHHNKIDGHTLITGDSLVTEPKS